MKSLISPFRMLMGLLTSLGLLTCGGHNSLVANGIDRNGVGAEGMGMAGASLTNEDDPLSTMGQNPANLTFFGKPEMDLGVAGAWAEGKFQTPSGTVSRLSDASGVLPEIALVTPLNKDFGFGLSIIPDSARTANWFFRDPEGGAGGNTSYGLQDHESEIINIRMAAGFAYRISPSFSIGASVGLNYTQNELDSPYTFQSHPVLAGFKTLLNMKTDGLGANGDIAARWTASDSVAFALTYRTPTDFNTKGDANGDITTQLRSLGLLGVPGQFHYDADIATKLPQKVALGGAWKITPNFRLTGQVEWVNWASAFDTLKVKLSNGSNPAINGLLGTNAIDDDIALHWQNEFVYRAGAEYDITKSFMLRAGYAYGKSPIPSDTLLPQTAAITEQTVALGVGYKSGPYRVDLAWQYDLPSSAQASASQITGPEYKNSTIDLKAQWVGITFGFQF